MALNVPSNTLTSNTIASTYDQLLFVDDTDGLEEAVLRQVASISTKSALWLAEEKVQIQSDDTDQAELFSVETVGNKSIILSGTGGVVINEDSDGDLDFRVETDGEDEALFMDASANTLYINKGETTFTTSIHSTNDVAMIIGSAGIIFNEDGHADNDFRVESDTNQNMIYVDAGSNEVGIGSSDPDTELHLVGEFTIDTGGGGAEDKYLFAPSAANDNISLSSRAANGNFTASLMTWEHDGKVGIGTTAPVNTFQVNHSAANNDNGIMIVNEATTIADGALLGAIGFDGADGNIPSDALESSCFIAAYAAEDHSAGSKGGDLTFGTTLIGEADDTTSTRHMTILDSGRVGIGTTTPGSILTVGDITANVDTLINIQCDTDNECGIRFIEETTTKWLLTNNGDSTDKLEVYDASDGSVAVHVVQGGSVWVNDSDERIKKDIENIGSVLDGINSLRPITWKRKYGKLDKTHVGLIAQEVKPHFPLVVEGDENDFKLLNPTEDKPKQYKGAMSIGYPDFVPYLIKAVQELSAKVTALENA